MWILVACAAIGTGIGLVVRRSLGRREGPKPIRVRPARPGPQSPAGCGCSARRPCARPDHVVRPARRVPGFGAVLGGEGPRNLYDPTTGRLGVIDATRNELAGRTNVPVQSGQSAEVAPVLAEQRGALAGDRARRLTRDELATGTTTEVTLPTDVVRRGRSARRDATRSSPTTRRRGPLRPRRDGKSSLPAAVRVADDGSLPRARRARPRRRQSVRAPSGRAGDGTLLIVGRQAGGRARPGNASPFVQLHRAAGRLAISHGPSPVACSGPTTHRAAAARLRSRRCRRAAAGGAHRRCTDPFRAPATLVAGADVPGFEHRVGSPNTLEQLITRVEPAMSARFNAPPQLEGEIAVSRGSGRRIATHRGAPKAPRPLLGRPASLAVVPRRLVTGRQAARRSGRCSPRVSSLVARSWVR